MADVNEIVSREAIQGVERLEKATQKTAKQVKSLYDVSKKLDGELKSLGISTKTAKTNQTKLNEAQKQALQVNKQTITVREKLKQIHTAETQALMRLKGVLTEETAVTKKAIDAKRSETDVWKKNQQSIERSNLSLSKRKRIAKLDVIATSALKGSYDQLSAKLKQNEIKYTALSSAQRANAQVGGKLQAKIKQQRIALKNLNTQMGKSQMGFNRLAGGVRSLMGAMGAMGGAIMLVSLFRSIGKTIAQFDEANAELASVLGVTREAMLDLTEAAIQYGKATKFTANEVTSFQISLARLGFTQSEIVASTGAILDLAQATGADLGEAATVTGGVLRAFGLSAGEAGRAASAMAIATTKSALTFGDYGIAMANVAPVAAAFGFTLEDSIALLGKLRDVNMDASKASTATRNIFLKMADANGVLSKAMGKPVKTFDELIPALIKLRDEGTDLNKILGMVGVRATAAFGAFLESAESAKILRDNITDVEGALKDMVAVRVDNVVDASKRLKSAWDGVVLSFRESSGAFKNILDHYADILNVMTDNTLSKMGKLKVLFGSMDESWYQWTKTLKDMGSMSIEELENAVTSGQKVIMDNTDQMGVMYKKNTILRKIYGVEQSKMTQSELNYQAKIILEARKRISLLEQVDRDNDLAQLEVLEKESIIARIDTAKALYEKGENEKGELLNKKEQKHLINIIDAGERRLTVLQIMADEEKALAIKAADKKAKAVMKIKEQTEVDDLKRIGKLTIAEMTVQLANEEITQKEFNERKKEIEATTQENILNVKIGFAAKNLENTELTEAQRLTIQNDAANLFIQLEGHRASEALRIARENKDEVLEAELLANQAAIEAAQQKVATVNATANAELLFQKQRYAQGIISVQEYADIVTQIELDKSLDIIAGEMEVLDVQRKNFQKQLENSNLLPEEKRKINTELEEIDKNYNEMSMEMNDIRTDHEIENAKKSFDKQKELKKALFDLGMQLASAAFEFAKIQSEKQISVLDEGLEQQLASSTSAKDRELEKAGDNEEQKKIINEKYALQKTAIEEKHARDVAKIKTQQAKRDKAQALFEIAINTAVASMKTIAELGLPFGLPFLIAVIAQGSIMAALVAARPIPKFAKGVKSSPKGMAEVGEKGRELGITPKGQAFIAGEKQIVNLDKGTRIFNNRETEEILNMNTDRLGYDMSELNSPTGYNALTAFNEMYTKLDSEGIIAAIGEGNDKLINTIKKKKEFHFNSSKGTITEREGGYYRNYLNMKIEA